MKTIYRHTQYGLLMFLIFLLAGILIAIVALQMIAEKRFVSFALMLGLYLLGLLLFHSFTIEIGGDELKFWFGIGILQQRIALDVIRSIKEVHNPWYYFWGVKAIPGGWFFAIAPGTAVEIELGNGRIVQLGTDQPGELHQAIETARTLLA